jgi:hypothetical protein
MAEEPYIAIGYERLFRSLASAVEACDLKAEKFADQDGFIKVYQMPCGPWHRVLGAARNGLTALEMAALEPDESAEQQRGSQPHEETRTKETTMSSTTTSGPVTGASTERERYTYLAHAYNINVDAKRLGAAAAIFREATKGMTMMGESSDDLREAVVAVLRGEGLSEGRIHHIADQQIDTILSAVRNGIKAQKVTDSSSSTESTWYRNGLDDALTVCERLGGESCAVCDGRGWHTAGGNDPTACGACPAGEAWIAEARRDERERIKAGIEALGTEWTITRAGVTRTEPAKAAGFKCEALGVIEGSRGDAMSERQQQIAEAIIAAHKSFDDSGRWSWKGYGEHIAVAAEPFLVAAERAGYERGQREDAAILEFGEAMSQARSEGRAEGYERCKQDAATAIKALGLTGTDQAMRTIRDSELLHGFMPWGYTSAFAGACRDAGEELLADALAALAALNATQQEASGAVSQETKEAT